MSAVLVFHIAAVVAGALAAQPSSPTERAAADLFAAYHQAIDQGYGYRYYAPSAYLAVPGLPFGFAFR